MTNILNSETSAEKHALSRVNKKINEVLHGSPLVMRPIMSHLMGGNGKNIRALSIIETSFAISGKISDEIIDFAAAVELLHLATLIHDDVIDEAVTRRGIETVQKKFGKKNAVLSGDFLFTKCWQLLSAQNKERMGNFASAVSHICIGEMLQHENHLNFDITERQYFRIIAGKTASLFALSLYGAAQIENAGEIMRQRLFRAGYYIGMAFQMTDDCLDYEGDSKELQKAVCKDLEEGFVTYPLLSAMREKPSLRAFLMQNRGRTMKLSEIKAVAAEVCALGGVDKTKERAERFYLAAVKNIRRALPDNNTDGLLDLARIAYLRKK